MVRILLDKKANVNCQNWEGKTPIHYVILNGHFEVAKVLLESGANANLQTSDHKLTPLHIAAYNGKTEFVELLLKHHCNSYIKDKHGKTAEDYAASSEHHDIAQLIAQKRMELLSLNQNAASNSSSNDCKICFGSKDGLFAFLPCGHAVACEPCCMIIIGSSDTCPICRKKVDEYKKIFV